jgi:hypothetical protein
VKPADLLPLVDDELRKLASSNFTAPRTRPDEAKKWQAERAALLKQPKAPEKK